MSNIFDPNATVPSWMSEGTRRPRPEYREGTDMGALSDMLYNEGDPAGITTAQDAIATPEAAPQPLPIDDDDEADDLHMQNVDTVTGDNMHMEPRSIFQIQRDLSQQFPKYHATKTQQGTELTFISWFHCQRLMSYYTNGLWHYRVVDRTILPSAGEGTKATGPVLSITVEIAVYSREGWVIRQGTGYEPLKNTSYGDPQSTAESMALRRACAKFGLGLYLYFKTPQ